MLSFAKSQEKFIKKPNKNKKFAIKMSTLTLKFCSKSKLN